MKEENKKRLDLSRYEPINSKDTIDIIMADMEESKIFPSDSLKIFLLQNIKKISVQKYLVEKFKETRDKIEHRTGKNNKKETK